MGCVTGLLAPVLLPDQLLLVHFLQNPSTQPPRTSLKSDPYLVTHWLSRSPLTPRLFLQGAPQPAGSAPSSGVLRMQPGLRSFLNTCRQVPSGALPCPSPGAPPLFSRLEFPTLCTNSQRESGSAHGWKRSRGGRPWKACPLQRAAPAPTIGGMAAIIAHHPHHL